MPINLGTTHARFPYRLKYFDHKYVDDNKLNEGMKIKGVFYARKHTNAIKVSYVSQTGIKSVKREISLYTEDNIKNMEIDDFVMFNGEKWIVQTIEDAPVSDTRDKSKWDGFIIKLRA